MKEALNPIPALASNMLDLERNQCVRMQKEIWLISQVFVLAHAGSHSAVKFQFLNHNNVTSMKLLIFEGRRRYEVVKRFFFRPSNICSIVFQLQSHLILRSALYLISFNLSLNHISATGRSNNRSFHISQASLVSSFVEKCNQQKS